MRSTIFSFTLAARLTTADTLKLVKSIALLPDLDDLSTSCLYPL
ncbi:hypothetical protein [Microcoleus sp. FACHB-1515]|nr:hypothetical protein [Microcoleus sp. FACHB-1515]